MSLLLTRRLCLFMPTILCAMDDILGDMANPFVKESCTP